MFTRRMTSFGPDFPFDFDGWLKSDSGLGNIPSAQHGQEVGIIGAGMAGMSAAFELFKLGLKPVIYEADQIGGRLRSQSFSGAPDIKAELGGMRFPLSATCFYHYADMLGLHKEPFPNPLSNAAGSTVIDLASKQFYARTLEDLPALFHEVARAYDKALDDVAHMARLKDAISAMDARRVKEIWDPLVRIWDDRTFYDFIATARPFADLSFRHREVFGQVGFGTGGWDSDFPNSMLEIMRVHATGQEDDQHWIKEGAQSIPLGLWDYEPDKLVHWPKGTSLSSLHNRAPRPKVARIYRDGDGKIRVIDCWGAEKAFDAVVVTGQTWLMTTNISVDESLVPEPLWMALDRTRYMQSSKTFVMVDRPFWKDIDPKTGRRMMSTTLTDRLTRGTYLFDYGDNQPAVICLTYSWMSDALKMLPLPVEKRVELALESLRAIYPEVDIQSHIISAPITVSWEADPNFQGAFKGALPGHYRYNRCMYGHFMQDDLPAHQKGLFLAGDDISWTPGWVEGAVQTALNAVWGVMHHFGGSCVPSNPGPGDQWSALKPVELR